MTTICNHKHPTRMPMSWMGHDGHEYIKGKVRFAGIDGMGTMHCMVTDICDTCGGKYIVCRFHLPKWLRLADDWRTTNVGEPE